MGAPQPAVTYAHRSPVVTYSAGGVAVGAHSTPAVTYSAGAPAVTYGAHPPGAVTYTGGTTVTRAPSAVTYSAGAPAVTYGAHPSPVTVAHSPITYGHAPAVTYGAGHPLVTMQPQGVQPVVGMEAPAEGAPTFGVGGNEGENAPY